MERLLLVLVLVVAAISNAVHSSTSGSDQYVAANMSSNVKESSNNHSLSSSAVVKNMKVRYDGDQMWFIESMEKKTEYVLQVLFDLYGAILWRTNGKQRDIFVPKSTVLLAKEFMEKSKQNYTVIVEDIQAEIDDQERQFVEANDFNWDNYHNYSLLEKFLKDVAEKFPDIVKLHTIGHTFEKRPLYVVCIGNNNPTNKVIWMDGGTHGREWASSAGITYVINQLVTKWADLPEHMRKRQWYIMPMVNPDGYEYSRKYDRMWGKNRRVSENSTGIGVDLNSNYDVEWNDERMFLDPSSNLYRGQSPLSENETTCLTNFALSLRPKPSVFLTCHNYGHVLFYPWAYKADVPSDFEDLQYAAEKTIKAIEAVTGAKYSTMPAYKVFGPAPGGADDWARAKLGVKYVYTVELAGVHQKGFLVPPSKLQTVSEEAFVIATTMSEVID